MSDTAEAVWVNTKLQCSTRIKVTASPQKYAESSRDKQRQAGDDDATAGLWRLDVHWNSTSKVNGGTAVRNTPRQIYRAYTKEWCGIKSE
jgi:hypothetical protein